MAKASLVAISLPADATNSLEAPTLRQVVQKSGDLMTGSLKISGPSAVNSLWLNGPGDVGIEWDGNTDSGALKFLVPSGGYIDCGGVVLANAFPTPFAATDLATKGYVDSVATTWVTVNPAAPTVTDIPARDGLIWCVSGAVKEIHISQGGVWILFFKGAAPEVYLQTGTPTIGGGNIIWGNTTGVTGP